MVLAKRGFGLPKLDLLQLWANSLWEVCGAPEAKKTCKSDLHVLDIVQILFLTAQKFLKNYTHHHNPQPILVIYLQKHHNQNHM